MTPKKFDGVPTESIFADDELALMRYVKEKRRGQRSVAMLEGCPECTRQPIGLVSQGEHHVYRDHVYETWSGAKLPCRASGVAVCILPPKRGKAKCPHDR